MIRAATLSDISAIKGIVAPELEKYPQLKADQQKISKLLTMAVSSAKHFCWVSVNDKDEVSGALVGITSENLWAQRQNCLIALWKAEIAGDGRKLLEEFKQWVRSRRAIRVAGFVPDSNQIDPRAYKLANRMGFQGCGGAHLLFN